MQQNFTPTLPYFSFSILQKSKKHKNKNKPEEDEIIVANEEHGEEGNDYPTIPMAKQSYQNAYLESGAPYFMATSDTINKHNQFEVVAETDKNGTARSYGKHTIPRPNVQQNYTKSTKKEDENHLVFRREDEKENDTETTGTGDDGEVFFFGILRFSFPCFVKLYEYLSNIL